MIEVARPRGATAWATGPSERRRAKAEELGAAVPVPPGDDLLDRVRAVTDGDGTPAVVEATGDRPGPASAPQSRVPAGGRMRLCTFANAGRRRIGALAPEREEDQLVDLTKAGVAGLERARAAAASGGHRLPLASVTPEAPIPRPGKIPRSGINHQGHAEGKPNARMPKEPFFLAKLSTAVIGHEGPIPHPTRTRQLDGEVELAEGVGVPHNPVVAG